MVRFQSVSLVLVVCLVPCVFAELLLPSTASELVFDYLFNSVRDIVNAR